MKRIHILMTNDDGYDAPGIKALALAVSDYARVTVVAPAHTPAVSFMP